MKIIRSIYLIFFFLFSVSFYGQVNDSLQYFKDSKSILYFSSNDDPLDLDKLNFQSEASSLVLYNGTTNSYNMYSNFGGDYSYKGSTTIFRNKSNFFTTLFLGNDSFVEGNTLLVNNKSLLLDEDVSYMVRDSFNPNGASNFSEAVLGGVLGLLFD